MFNRLCGPGEKIFADTMETCCAYAYASKTPSFCSVGATRTTGK
jgi:hypothetical protein